MFVVFSFDCDDILLLEVVLQSYIKLSRKSWI